MTKDTAVNILCNDYLNTINEDYQGWNITSWSEMIDAFGQDSDDIKDDVWYTLSHFQTENSVSNQLMIYELDNGIYDGETFISYRSLMGAVRSKMNKKLSKLKSYSINK